jgi:hypothetical protein
MSKDYLTDYATTAIRFHKRVGGLEKWRKDKEAELTELAAYRKDREEIGYIQGDRADPTWAAFRWSEGEMSGNSMLRQWADLEAVEKMYLSCILLENGKHRIKAIEIVYCQETDREYEKGEISRLVAGASLIIPASERAIYKWLRDARLLFARARGLRLEQWHIDRLQQMRIE